MKRTGLIAAGLGIAAAISAPAIASGLEATASAGGQIQVFETPPLTGTTGKVLITGALGDYGKSVKINKAGEPDATGTYNRLELHKGTIVASTATLQKRIRVGSENAHVDLSSCSLEGSVSAPVPIVSGTGAYTGITGTIKITFTLAELGATYTSGPKQGQCNTNRGPIAQFATIHGSGSVSFK